MVAAGGVNQSNAADFITAGAVALGISTALVPAEAVESRNRGWIAELARRFLYIVSEARASIKRR